MKHILSTLLIAMSITVSAEGGAASPDHKVWHGLLQKYVGVNGQVNYTGFKSDPNFDTYLLTLSGSHPDNSWSRNEKMAYWINAYNAFTIKLVSDNLPLKSIKDIGSPWDIKFISIEGTSYSLNDIEHKILRPQFNDPRIHFAVNCASIGCPPLSRKAFTATALDNQLNTVSRAFVTNSAYNTLQPESASLSKIFEWFVDDFSDVGGVISFLNQYAQVKVQNDARLTYNDYDWNLNGK